MNGTDTGPAPVRRTARSRFVHDVSANLVGNLLTVAILWLVAQATDYVRGSSPLTAIAAIVLATALFWGGLWLVDDRLGPSPMRLYWPVAVVAAVVTAELVDVTMTIDGGKSSLLVKLAIILPMVLIVSMVVRVLRRRRKEQ